MDGKAQRYEYQEAMELLRLMAEDPPEGLEWDREKQKLSWEEGGEVVGRFRFPLPWPVPEEEESLEAYVERLPEHPEPYLMLLIQAGHSSIGYFEEGEVLQHKTIKKYMVRGKGKAQVSYLGSRGKSKAGSRIRLANSVSFFEDINSKIREWEVADEVARILWACPVRLQPLLFGSRVQPPFEKDDARLIKIPLDIRRPDHEEMLRINRICLGGYLEGELPVDLY